MFHRSSRLFVERDRPLHHRRGGPRGGRRGSKEVSGWGRVLDPSRDCDVSLDLERDRLRITVPGTPHVLSAEDPSLPMNAPRVVRRVRGDFTASRPGARPARPGAVEDHVLRPLPRRRPDRLAGPVELPPARTGRRVHQRAASSLPQLRVAGGRSPGHVAGITIEDHSLFLKLRRQGRGSPPGTAATAATGSSLSRIDATLDERVEVGVAAVNSSARTLSAELERLSVNDPQGSMARDWADDSEKTGAPSSGIERIGDPTSGDHRQGVSAR